MNQPPRKEPETGLFAPVQKQINKILDYLRETSPKTGVGLRTNRTVNGTVVSVRQSTRAAETPQAFQWQGEWVDRNYSEGDVVIRGSANLSSASWNDTDTILSDGTKAGVYIALRDVPAGTAAPLEPNTATYWETLARFATHIFVVKKTGSADIAGVPQAILLDGTSPNGAIRARLADCNGKVLSVREVAVCVSGVEMKMMVLGSAPYT